MFEDLIRQIEGNLEKAKDYQQLQSWIPILKQDFEILKNLKQEDIAGLLWYTPESLQRTHNIQSGNLLGVLNHILSNINTALLSMVRNPSNHNYWQTWYNTFSFYSQLLHTILSDFGFDIRYRKEIVKRGIREVRKGLNQIEDLLKDAKAQKARIDEITEEVENASDLLPSLK